MSKKNFYITSSIAYSNAPPHLGFALELVQADVIARYHRLLGDNVYFTTGTDEHGGKVAKKAKELGKEPQEFCNEISSKFQQLKQCLNLSFDDFIRTTDKKRHLPTAQRVWQQLRQNNDLYKANYKGYYCQGCEAFLTEKDLVDGKCPNHQKPPEIIEEENYFFKLSKYAPKIKKIIEQDKIKIIPKTRKNEILSFIEQGVEDVSFSRSAKTLKWGIPVPGDPDQRIYVWIDALSNYLSVLGYHQASSKFKQFWPPSVQCIGKDILRFHALYWPAMLLSLNLPLPETIFVHGYITCEGQKMSKSLGNVLDPFELVEKYGVDPIRYYLLREIPPFKDGDFSRQRFKERYNADLASGLGNLVARVTTMAEKILSDKEVILSRPQGGEESRGAGTGSAHPSGFFGQSPQNDSGDRSAQNDTESQIKKTWGQYHKALQAFRFNEALEAIWGLIRFCDKYIEQNRVWEQTPDQASKLYELLTSLAEISKMLQPFLPQTSTKIANQLGLSPSAEPPYSFQPQKAPPLFPRLSS